MLCYSLILLYLLHVPCSCLLCYNGTLSSLQYGDDPLANKPLFSNRRAAARLRCSLTVNCDGPFIKHPTPFNESSYDLINCTDNEHSMCFVRAWSARAHHAWIVQRGCYSVGHQDPFLREMITPTRAMTCKQERLTDAEYTVCLCKSDWCNSVGPVDSKIKFGYFVILWYSI